MSDPVANAYSVTFTTNLPTGASNSNSNSLCISGYGGQTNVWSLSCSNGDPNQSGSFYIISTSSDGLYTASASANNTTGIIGTFSGVPSIKGSTTVNSSSNKGIIIQWLEK